jgi:signal transduction histidine kinase
MKVARGLQFRHRIGLLVAVATLALVGVTLVTLVLGRRSEQQLAGIETRYVPLIELDRDLKRLNAEVAKSLEDAADAAEPTTLADADALSAQLLARLDGGRATIAGNGADPAVLEAAFRTYYASARAIAAELIEGTPAGQLAEDITGMLAAHKQFNTLLAAATTADRNRLSAAFESTRASQREALVIVIVVAMATLVFMVVASLRLVRRTVASLSAVSAGVERLAEGDFAREIAVPSSDEIGDLAREANRTASRLREYLEARDREALAAQTANKELEAFSSSVSHDLRAPLRSIDGFSQAILEDEADRLTPDGREHLRRIRAAAQRMAELIDDLLRLSRVSRVDFKKEPIDLSAIAGTVNQELRKAHPDRDPELVVQPGITAHADARLIRIVLENLLGNAWKFTGKVEKPRIELGVRDDTGGTGERVYYVKDNGAGFDMRHVDRLFGAFQRLHTDKEFPGTGIGLATVQRIVLRHGGRIWVDAAVGEGATFQFTLPPAPATQRDPQRASE